MFKN
jgi:hypothetical protein